MLEEEPISFSPLKSLFAELCLIRACFAHSYISQASSKGFFSLTSLLFFMAMATATATSLGNNVCQTKACRRVNTSNTTTIVDDMKESASARPLLRTPGTFSAYLIVVTDAVVMGKV